MLSLRRATADDVSVILELIRELATYEREPDAVVATEADLLRDGFGEQPAFHVLLADWREGDAPPETIGFAFWFFTYSTWVGRRSVHLEDLFVKPSHRGRGAGVALMRALAREAVAAGCGRFGWQVLDWNEPAIRFYESLGARVLPEWQSVRVEGAALRALAG
jgi:GNAT superfamily N-acetyltransferase